LYIWLSVSNLFLCNFGKKGSFDEVNVSFSTKGIVMVFWSQGSGKSTFLEDVYQDNRIQNILSVQFRGPGSGLSILGAKSQTPYDELYGFFGEVSLSGKKPVFQIKIRDRWPCCRYTRKKLRFDRRGEVTRGKFEEIERWNAE